MPTLPLEKWLKKQSKEEEFSFYHTYQTLKTRVLNVELTQTIAEFKGGNDHGPQHILRVMSNLSSILGPKPLQYLGVMELWLSMMSVLYHDLGLLQARAKHPEIGSAFVAEEKNYLIVPEHVKEFIQTAVYTHGSHADIDERSQGFPKHRKIGNHSIDMKLICALVRLADELDEDIRRGDVELYLRRNIEKMYPDSVPYWKFNQSIPGIAIDQPTPSNRGVEFQIKIKRDDEILKVKNKDGETQSFVKFFFEKIVKIRKELFYCNKYLPESLKFLHMRLTLLDPKGEGSAPQSIILSEHTSLDDLLRNLPSRDISAADGKSSVSITAHTTDRKPVHKSYDNVRIIVDQLTHVNSGRSLEQKTLITDPHTAPVPCIIDGTHCDDALSALMLLISNYKQERYRQREIAYAEAREYAFEKVMLQFEQANELDAAGIKSVFQNHYARKLSDLLTKHEPATLRLLISGENGAGKTTLAKRLAGVLGARLIDLRQYSSATGCILPEPTQTTKSVVEQLAFHDEERVVVLDALDRMYPGATYEMTTRLLREITSTTNDYHVLLLTVRTQYFRSVIDESIPDYKRVSILPLDIKDVISLSQVKELGLQSIVTKSSAIQELARKPLLLTILTQLAQEGKSLSEVESEESLFSLMIDQWLQRDTAHSIIPAHMRLKCMQILALRALASGGVALRYEDINSVAAQLLTPLDPIQLEKLNMDLRVCGFLGRHETDVFEFQHASFYEYCIARTIFEDIEKGDFIAINSEYFTPPIIDFFVQRAVRQGKKDSLLNLVSKVWSQNPTGSCAIGNLLMLYIGLGGKLKDISLSGRVLEKVSFSHIAFDSAIQMDNVSFKNCDFSETRWDRFIGQGLNFANCLFENCAFDDSKLTSSTFSDCNISIASVDKLTVRYSTFSKGRIRLVNNACLIIEGGRIEGTKIETKDSAVVGLIIAQATLVGLVAGESWGGMNIQKCNIDPLTQFVISELNDQFRPSVSKEIEERVARWKKQPERAAWISSSQARETPPVSAKVDLLANFSRSKRRAYEKARRRMQTINEDSSPKKTKPPKT